MRLFLRLAPGVLAAFFVTACASSDGSDGSSGPGSPNTGSGDDPGTKVEPPKPHPLCAGAGGTSKSFPDDLGNSCSMGSNLDLCASTHGTECSSNTCLWDDTDPTASFGTAYCTIECDPSAADACPTGWACKAQGCSSGPANVCVKTERSTPEAQSCESVTDDFPDLSSSYITDFAVSKDGRIYVLIPYYSYEDKTTTMMVLSKDKSGSSWTKIFETAGASSGGIASPARAVSGTDQVVFATSATSVVILSGTHAETAELPACTGDPNTCVQEVSAFFATTSGDVRAYARNIDGDYWLLPKLAPGTLEVGGQRKDSVSQIVGLAGGGFVASCTSATSSQAGPCTSADGETLTPLELPTGESFATVVATGESLDDFYFLGGSGKLLHRVKGEWLTEGISGAPAEKGRFSIATLNRATDGTLFAGLAGPKDDKGSYTARLYALTDGCWKPLPKGTRFDGVPAADRTFVSAGERSICTAQPKLGD